MFSSVSHCFRERERFGAGKGRVEFLSFWLLCLSVKERTTEASFYYYQKVYEGMNENEEKK